MNQMKIAVVGGDLRSIMLAKMLRSDGHYVKTYGLESAEDGAISDEFSLENAVKDCQIVAAPVPLSEDGKHVRTPFSKKVISLTQLVQALENHPSALLIGGRTKALSELCPPQVQVIDLLQREDMAILNAIPTVEGALQLAMEKTSQTLWDSRCLILGYGRIGKLLAQRLHSLGAHVTAVARKFSDLAWIRSNGYQGIHFSALPQVLDQQDIIFNTVPFTVLGKEELDAVNRACVIIDLASQPGGVDFQYARAAGLNVNWALSLPGKVAPVTAGRIMKDTLYNIAEEFFPLRR
jgi:dipicolinate synthase subunit A